MGMVTTAMLTLLTASAVASSVMLAFGLGITAAIVEAESVGGDISAISSSSQQILSMADAVFPAYSGNLVHHSGAAYVLASGRYSDSDVRDVLGMLAQRQGTIAIDQESSHDGGPPPAPDHAASAMHAWGSAQVAAVYGGFLTSHATDDIDMDMQLAEGVHEMISQGNQGMVLMGWRSVHGSKRTTHRRRMGRAVAHMCLSCARLGLRTCAGVGDYSLGTQHPGNILHHCISPVGSTTRNAAQAAGKGSIDSPAVRGTHGAMHMLKCHHCVHACRHTDVSNYI